MQKFAAFDIDGTLIRWQLYHAMVDQLAQEGLLGKNVAQELHQARMDWKLRLHPNAFRNYEVLLIDRFDKALPKLSHQDFDRIVDAVLDEYREQVYTYTRDLLRSLKKRGYFLIAISGSHNELVRAVAEHYEFDYAIGTHYERDAAGFTGVQKRVNSNKAQTLSDIIQAHRLTPKSSYAVGDTAGDAGMLELVENPIAFNPDKELFAIAKAKGWKIVVERKNVVYQLESQNGQHVLA